MAVVLKAPLMAAVPPSPFLRPSQGLVVVSMSRPLGTSFLNNGVEALKVKGIQTAYSRRLRCRAHGGGALGAEMNIFSRFFRLMRAYANSILSYFEDPEKMLEQIISEMSDDLNKMHQATAEVLASQKRLENKYKAAERASDDWYCRAQRALAKGAESLAREALRRRKSYAETASSLRNQFDQQKMVVDSLLEKTRLLENKIHDARSKKDTLKLRAQTAKTANKVNEILGNVNTSSALSAFERMEEKVSAMEYQVESLNHLTTDDLERKFIKLEGTSVDDDFARLKGDMTERSLKQLLSESTTVTASNHYLEMELESELVEL